jgi:hypothetical protein
LAGESFFRLAVTGDGKGFSGTLAGGGHGRGEKFFWRGMKELPGI